MRDTNFFLQPGGAPTVNGGGGGYIENAAAVENIVFQTRGAALGTFEARLADDLMQVKEGAPRDTAQPMWFDANDNAPLDIDFTYFIRSCVPRSSEKTREIGFIKPI